MIFALSPPRFATGTAIVAAMALTLAGCSGGSSAPANRSPIAVADHATTPREQGVDIDVLANDSDPDGDPLTLTGATGASHGMVVVEVASVSYVPEAGFSGDDTFTYTISDGRGGSANGTVVVTVTGPNSAPVATAPGPLSTLEDVALALTLTGSDAESQEASLGVEIVSGPTDGTLSAPYGSAPFVVTYTPPPNWSGSASFTFRVRDPAGAPSSSVVVTITVTAVNDTPVATPPGALATEEDQPVAVTLTGTDAETPESGLVVSIVSPPVHGSLGMAPKPAPLATYYVPDPNFSGTDSFSFRVTDGDGGQSPVVTVDVTVSAVNDLPVATPRTVIATEDVPSGIELTGTDLESTASTLLVELLAPPAHGTVTPGIGPAPLTVQYVPAANYSGQDSFTFRVTDPDGGVSEPATVSVDVVAVNDPPVATPILPVSTDEATPVGLVLTGTDIEDAPTSLEAQVSSAPQHGTVTPSSGMAPLTVTYTPATGWSGTDGFSFRLRDSEGLLSVEVAVVVEVRPTQAPPVANADAAVTCIGSSTIVRVLANDTDPEGDALALVSTTHGAHGATSIAGAGVTYTPEPGYSGPDSFDYVVSDGHGGTATGAVSVTVSGPFVSSLFPAKGTTGIPLQISGRCLGAAAGTVTIGGRSAEVSTWTATYVVATVPTDFLPGAREVLVTPPSGPAGSASYEIVPWIGLVEPWYADPGEPQSVLGDAFVTPAGSVSYASTVALVDGWTNTAIQSRMPLAGDWKLQAQTTSGLYTNVYPVTGGGPGTWQTDRVPDGRLRHTAVWTGTEMIVWGGENQGVPGAASGSGGLRYSSGGRYDPRFDAWAPTIQTFNTPSARSRHTVVWTGKEMIVWGGYQSAVRQDGARYDPALDRWTATSTTSAPAARQRHSAVWTGSRMIVWGGADSGALYVSTGGSYDPVSNAWSATPSLDAPSPRAGHVAIWTGTEMIVWGGYDSTGKLATGARYDPVANRWTPMATVGAPSGRDTFAAVWTGTELMVWGGYSGSALLATGARYDPATDAWTPIQGAGAPEARRLHTAIWSGRELIVWGGQGATRTLASGGRYDPASDTWTSIDGGTAPIARAEHSAIWTGREMIVWGGLGALDTGARYDPATDSWTATRVGEPGQPPGRRDHAAACVDGDLLVWGGSALGIGDVATGARYRSATHLWTPLAAAGAPSAREGHTAVWTGANLIVWGGKYVAASGATTYLSDGARYDPALDAWTALPTSGAPSARSGHTAVWAGSKMVVWGGQDASAVLQTGAAYDPATNAWEPLPTTNAPVARRAHSAVSTGAEMIVWGGEAMSGSPEYASGARYDVATATWTPLPATSLAARKRHTAVWTGTEMLVWGGFSSATGQTWGDGAGFSPSSGTWSAMTPQSLGTTDHAAVWTGTEMLVWGGNWAGAYRGVPNRYDPVTKLWTQGPLTGNPLGRDRPSACWTGTALVVWGGSYNGHGMAALGRYRP
jgi:N-acetylneuraminic acid mutarotase